MEYNRVPCTAVVCMYKYTGSVRQRYILFYFLFKRRIFFFYGRMAGTGKIALGGSLKHGSRSCCTAANRKNQKI